jgi:hypothetical protein
MPYRDRLVCIAEMIPEAYVQVFVNEYAHGGR